MENKNIVDIHVVIPDYAHEHKEDEITSISGNPFAILATCASIAYNVGLDVGFSKDGIIKEITKRIERLAEHDKIE